MSVRRLLQEMDSAELSEWLAYLQLEAEREKNGGVDEDEAWRQVFKPM